MADRIVVKLTWGVESPERVGQALTVCVTATAAGVPVSLWLTGDASWLATAGVLEQVELPFAGSLADSRDAVLAAGAITVCSQCAARRGLTETDLLPGVRIAGSAVFVEEILAPGACALVY